MQTEKRRGRRIESWSLHHEEETTKEMRNTGEVRENPGCIFMYLSLLEEFRFTIKFTTVKPLGMNSTFHKLKKKRRMKGDILGFHFHMAG